MSTDKRKKQSKGKKRGEPVDPYKAVDRDKWFTDRGMPTMEEFIKIDMELRPWGYEDGVPVDSDGEPIDMD